MSFIPDQFKLGFGRGPNEKTVELESPPSGSQEPILTAEEAELAKLGYKQEFTREFSWLSTFSFAFSISGLLATVKVPSRFG